MGVLNGNIPTLCRKFLMQAKTKIIWLSAVVSSLLMYPAAFALTTTMTNGSISETGDNEFLTDFGMLRGSINFRLGDFRWGPQEIWLIPSEIDPKIFSSGLKQLEVLEIPKNITFSTCRTAVYLNESVGYGFKIYNTGTTTQILQNGTFCGLAYSGTYFVYARY